MIEPLCPYYWLGPLLLDHAIRNTDYVLSTPQSEHAPGRVGKEGRGSGEAMDKNHLRHDTEISGYKEIASGNHHPNWRPHSRNGADGILLDGSARNVLADTALGLWFTRHTRDPVQEGDPAWALAQLQVNAQ